MEVGRMPLLWGIRKLALPSLRSPERFEEQQRSYPQTFLSDEQDSRAEGWIAEGFWENQRRLTSPGVVGSREVLRKAWTELLPRFFLTKLKK
jgi:hypothetical protein